MENSETQQGDSSDSKPINLKTKEATLRHNVQQSKATNWAAWMNSLTGGEEGEEQFKNRQAENQWVRENLWGYGEPEGDESEAEDEMSRKYVMGDNTETTHHHHPAPKGLGTLAKAGIAAALIGSGLGAGAAAPIIIDIFQNAGGESSTKVFDYDVDTRVIPP